jgi:hypothetical protein
MIYNGIRRCDLCTAEILGHGGADICVVCRIAMEEESDLRQTRAPEEWEALEGFSLAAVVGRSDVAAGEVVAANDDHVPRQTLTHARRNPHTRDVAAPQGIVHRFAAGLRSISRRRLVGRR